MKVILRLWFWGFLTNDGLRCFIEAAEDNHTRCRVAKSLLTRRYHVALMSQQRSVLSVKCSNSLIQTYFYNLHHIVLFIKLWLSLFQFALMENVLTSFCDEYPHLRNHKAKFCIILGVICFLLGLPCVTRVRIPSLYLTSHTLIIILYVKLCRDEVIK